MKLQALATDYDGTIAWHGSVTESTCDALQRFKVSGRKLILVTGRELRELYSVFPEWRMFDLIVAENGALLLWPATGQIEILGPEPPHELVERLREEGVHPLSVGQGLVATQETYRGVIEKLIDELEAPWRVVMNKGALMILPRTVDKATGLKAALERLQLEPAQVVGVGDAENDFVFLRMCGCSVAVGNAIPTLKEQVSYVARGSRGAGVEELIEMVLKGEDLIGRRAQETSNIQRPTSNIQH